MTKIRANVEWWGVVRRLTVGILLLAALLAVTTSVSLAAPPSQDPAAGESVWAEAGCKNCHGESGEGLWAGPLAGHEKTAEEWIEQVRNPDSVAMCFEGIGDSDPPTRCSDGNPAPRVFPPIQLFVSGQHNVGSIGEEDPTFPRYAPSFQTVELLE